MKKVIFIILIVILLIGTILVVKYKATPEEDKILNSLYSLDKNIDEEGLEKKGYINISVIKEQNPDIKKFLKTLKGDYKKSILKVFKFKGNELYVKVFYYDPKWKLIRLWTYFPGQQGLDAPDKTFSTDYEILKDGDVASIKLINVKNQSMAGESFLSDEILYSYYEK